MCAPSTNTADFTAEHARFCALWTRCLTQPAIPEQIALLGDQLVALYGEPHRHYHTLKHIQRCLEALDRTAATMDDPRAVEMALWLHDAIYQPGADDNERRSGELFLTWSEGQMSDVFRQHVFDLIMATTHRDTVYQGDARFVVDIDLSGFGLPWAPCERDGQLVRAEFPQISDADYYPAHIRFVRALHGRPTIFWTEPFRAAYEATARHNLARIIADAEARGLA